MSGQQSALYFENIMKATFYKQQFIKRRKEQGLCIKCGKPLDREGVHCIACRKIISENERENRHWYQSHGICPRCGKNDLFGDEKVCPECNAKVYKNTMNSRNKLGKEHYNQKHAEWAKKEHYKRIEQGICTRCGKRNADYGFKTCGICRTNTRNYKRTKYGKPDRNERYKQGMCYFCNNPIKDGYKVCEKHYQINVKNARSKKANEARTKLIKNNILY